MAEVDVLGPLDRRRIWSIVSVAVTIATGVNTDGRREVLGMALGASEAETFWSEFLRSLARRGLRGVKLVISDAHVGLQGKRRQIDTIDVKLRSRGPQCAAAARALSPPLQTVASRA